MNQNHRGTLDDRNVSGLGIAKKAMSYARAWKSRIRTSYSLDTPSLDVKQDIGVLRIVSEYIQEFQTYLAFRQPKALSFKTNTFLDKASAPELRSRPQNRIGQT